MTNTYEDAGSRQLEVRVEQQIGLLNWNFEELNAQLDIQLAKYENLVFTDQDMREAKAMRANLNKVAKAINDRKLEVKRQFCAPYDAFAEQAKQLVDKVNKVSGTIDSQVKDYENRMKEEKRQRIEQYWKDHSNGLFALDKVFDIRWLNSSVSDAQWQKNLEAVNSQINKDISVLNAYTGEKYNWCLNEYLKTMDLGGTLAGWEIHVEELRRIEELRAQQTAQIKPVEKDQPKDEETPEPVAVVQQAKQSRTWWTITAELQGTTEDMRWLNDAMKAKGMKILVKDRKKEER